MTRLAFLQLSNARFREISSVLLPSCSQLTYSVNTQQVTRVCTAEDEQWFPRPCHLQLAWECPFRCTLSDEPAMKIRVGIKFTGRGRVRRNPLCPSYPVGSPLCVSGCGARFGQIAVLTDPHSTNQSLEAVRPKEGDTEDPKGTPGARPPASGEPRRALATVCSGEVHIE